MMLILTGIFIEAGDELQSVFTICLAMMTQQILNSIIIVFQVDKCGEAAFSLCNQFKVAVFLVVKELIPLAVGPSFKIQYVYYIFGAIQLLAVGSCY